MGFALNNPKPTGSSMSGLSIIEAINGVSPKPNYDGADITNASSGNLFGLEPDDVSGQFDDSYNTAVEGYDPFPGDKSKINQLQRLYGTVGSAYDVSDTLESLGATRKTNLLSGEQASNTAARKFEESSIPGASSGVGASMVRAQALLPFLQNDQTAAGEERQYADSAKQKALGAAADIATNLAKLTQDYTNSLATYNSNKANFGLDYAGKKTDLALSASTSSTASRLESGRLAEQARQANLQAALQARGQDMNETAAAREARISASNSYLSNSKGPTGGYTTNNLGQITSGQGVYDELQQYKSGRSSVLATLAGIGG